jgi:outer membrane protein assembly factor BamB
MSSDLWFRAPVRHPALLVALAFFLTTVTAAAQPLPLQTRPGPLGVPGKPEAPVLPMQLPANPRAQLRLKAAADFIKEEAWAEAVRDLQWLLDLKEDTFVEVDKQGPDGKKAVTWSSVRTEANRLLASLPPVGRERYELEYGPTATHLLQEARDKTSPEKIAEVAQRFSHTKAWVKALPLLGHFYLDTGDWALAAFFYGRLLGRLPVADWEAETLFHATRAFRLAGNKSQAEKIWKEFTRKADKGSIRIGDRTRTVQEWEKELDRDAPEIAAVVIDWPMYRGNASRTAQGNGGTPFLEKRYARPTVGAQTVENQFVDSPTAKNLLAQAVKTLQQRDEAVLPSFFPIAADGKIFYRSYWGVHALDAKSGKLAWEAGSKLSLEYLIKDSSKWQYLNNWVQAYLGGQAGPNIGRPGILLENSTTGTLSTDNQFVFVVDDLPLPPLPNPGMDDMKFPGGGRVGSPNYGTLTNAVSSNRLLAYSLKAGKLLWELGGKADKPGEPDFSDTFFLGPPLPLQKKLYVLTEKAQELRLACIDPNKAEVVWTQSLAVTKNKLLADPIRRTQAAHLAYGEGILVCPTNAGAIFGVDLLTHGLIWAHFYREKSEAANPYEAGMLPPGVMMPAGGGAVMMPGGNPNNRRFTQSEWKVTAPAVQDGRVVFTAPDGSGIHCLDLRDGTLLWKANRADDDLYLGGVIAGKVLLVGKKECRALNLADGAEAWRKETGKPSGQGVASGGIYYLPLRSSAANRDESEVCAIDVAKGDVVAHVKSRRQDVPGNLLFYEGDVLSQGVDEVVAFPQMKVKLDQVNELIAKNPNDPAGLTERGELKLGKGDYVGAVEDLREALANNPPKEVLSRARELLFQTLTEWLQRDFNAAEKYLDEYRDLCKVPVDPAAPQADRVKAEKEQQRRNAAYHFLLARGRESQGKLVEAFDAYLQLASLGADSSGASLIGDRGAKVPPEVLARGQINALLARATEEQRKSLEERIAKKYAEIKEGPDPAALRGFVALFGLESKVGREARLQLAERLMGQEGTGNLLETERELLLLWHQKADVQMAARAVEALARLMARKGLLDDAAHYYRILGREFANVKVRDGKTGEDLFKEMATDKRFLPYLDEPEKADNDAVKIKVKEEFGAFQQTKIQFQFAPDGEVLPFFQRHRAILDLTNNGHDFKLIDRLTGEEKLKLPLTRTTFQQFLWAGGNNTPPRYAYQTVGHVVVLPLGHMVFAIDTINKKLLWERSLIGAALGQQNPNVTVDPRDNSVVLSYADGFTQRLGYLPPVQASYVCLQTRDGLVALDPITGATLWTRPDINPRSQIFGDGQHVFVVEMNQEGKPAGTRALNALDGTAVSVPDFAALFDKRLRVLGGNLLVSDTVTGGGVLLRLYDVRNGKDLWDRVFPAGSVLLRCEQPYLAGAVDPKGHLTVFDLRTQNTVLEADVEPKSIDKAQGVALLQDRTQFYLLVNGPQDANVNPWGGPWSNLMPTTGIQSLPVNGMVYVFDRETGKFRWKNEVAQQMLMLESWDEMPVLLFTSRYQKLMGAGVNRWAVNGVSVKVIDKHSGKMKYDQPELNNNNAQQFHAFSWDRNSGTIQLTSYNFKVTLTQEK